MNAHDALERLKKGNEHFLAEHTHTCNVSSDRVAELDDEGQAPFAIVLSCSDSRVPPEHVFMTGLGELFVIRVAGNIAGNLEVASAVYAAEHLGAELILVMGHTHCGAIKAALDNVSDGCVHYVTDEIKKAIGKESDPVAATIKNVEASMATLEENPQLQALKPKGLVIAGAVYDTHTGEVTFL